MGYHVYKELWRLVQGEKLKAIINPKSIEDNFAVVIMKNNCLVGHLPKENTRGFVKTVFLFFYEPVTVIFACWKSLAKLSIKEIRKEWRSHASFFLAEKRFINTLKQKLPKTLWNWKTFLKLSLSWYWNIFPFSQPSIGSLEVIKFQRFWKT